MLRQSACRGVSHILLEKEEVVVVKEEEEEEEGGKNLSRGIWILFEGGEGGKRKSQGNVWGSVKEPVCRRETLDDSAGNPME